jgi:hypothetical protein
MDNKKYIKDYVRMSSTTQEVPRGEGMWSQVEREKLLSGMATMAVLPHTLYPFNEGRVSWDRAPVASVNVTICSPLRHTHRYAYRNQHTKIHICTHTQSHPNADMLRAFWYPPLSGTDISFLFLSHSTAPMVPSHGASGCFYFCC